MIHIREQTNNLREHRRIDDNGGDDEDLRRLVRIRMRLLFTSPHRSRDRPANNDGNKHKGNNQHEGNQNSVNATGRVWGGCLNSDHHGNSNYQPNMNHRANLN